MSFSERNVKGVTFMTAPTISARHAFTTRFGGASEGIFASLNLSTSRGDSEAAVRAN